MPLVAPSWFTALPRITARIGSPSARARERGFRITIPAPSPRTMPLALESKARQRPSGLIAPPCEKLIERAGERMRLTPPASARVDSPRQRLWQARWTATNEDEQAVSTARLGPRKSKTYERRLAATLR